jgi:hypothetical protein
VSESPANHSPHPRAQPSAANAVRDIQQVISNLKLAYADAVAGEAPAEP